MAICVSVMAKRLRLYNVHYLLRVNINIYHVTELSLSTFGDHDL